MNCKKHTSLVSIYFDLCLYVLLSIFMLCKALRRGLFYSNILFNHATFYYTLALSFIFSSLYCIVRISGKKRKKVLSIVLLSIIFILFCSAILLVIKENTTSLFYPNTSDPPKDIEIIEIDDVFRNTESINCESNSMQIRSWRPILGTVVNEVQQAVSGESNGYFYTIKLISSKWLLLGFNEEILEFLVENYEMVLDEDDERINKGQFHKDGYEYRFILKIDKNSLSCIIYRGNILLEQELIYPL